MTVELRVPLYGGIYLRRIPMVTTPWNRQKMRLAVLLSKIRHAWAWGKPSLRTLKNGRKSSSLSYW